MNEVKEWLKKLETSRIVLSQAQKEAFEKEAGQAIEENQPYVGVWHQVYIVGKCTCQIAYVNIWNPSEAPWFSGWIKYFVGNGIIIDPETMKKPGLPGVFNCVDKRFPEFMRRVNIGPNSNMEFRLPYQVPANIEEGSYFGNVFLIQQSWPFPQFVSGAYADFEVIECEPSVQACNK